MKEASLSSSSTVNLTKRVMRKMERKKKKRQKATWAGLGTRKVAMVTTRMARLQVRISARLPRSQKKS